MAKLSELSKLNENIRSAKRVGRGIGSGKGGHVAGRGMKGQKSRTGGKVPIWFEGGQTGLAHGMPYKGGFSNHGAKVILNFNLSDLSDVIASDSKITPETLEKAGLIKVKKFHAIKILGRGTIDKKIEFDGFLYAKKAAEKIVAAGGSAKPILQK